MINQEIIDYLKASLEQGRTKEELYQELLQQGWTIEVIQENFNAIHTSQEKEDLSKKTIKIVVAVGVILIGAGIFSFIAANWQAMGRPTKIVVILAAMLLAYGAGWWLKEKANLPKTGEALIFLGAVIYGAGIFLVAQMFNIRANWPDGFILWMFGVLALAFATESYPLFYLALPLGLIAVAGNPIFIFYAYVSDSFLLTSSFLLLAATAITFLSGLIIRRRMPEELKELY